MDDEQQQLEAEEPKPEEQPEVENWGVFCRKEGLFVASIIDSVVLTELETESTCLKSGFETSEQAIAAASEFDASIPSKIPVDAEVKRTGVLSFKELADILVDHLAKMYPEEKNSEVAFDWTFNQHTKELACKFSILASQVTLEKEYTLHDLALSVFEQYPDLVLESKQHSKQAINYLTGHLTKAMWDKFKMLEPEKAFELVVNLLELTMPKPLD